MANSDETAWYLSRRFHIFAFWLLGIILVIEFRNAMMKENDFTWHCDRGQDFLAGAPFGTGHEHYPLARTMMDAVLVILPPLWTRACCYGLAVLALYGIWRMWSRLAGTAFPATTNRDIAAVIGSFLALLPFVLRDFDECGLQIFFLFFLSAAGCALASGQALRCGFWLATAVSYKATPILALPFLLWKRQWRAAGWMTVFLALWSIAPALYLGWDTTVQSHLMFYRFSRTLAAAHQGYPSLLDREPPNVRNLSLAATIDRYLETVQAGHHLYLDHPFFLQFGDLDSELAYNLVRGTILLLGLIVAWRFRHAYTPGGTSPALAGEWAVLCLACALLSPLCWKQHLVMAFPMMYLLLRSCLAEPKMPRIRQGLVIAFTLVAMLGRKDVIGGELSLVLMSYKIDTLFILLLTGVLMSLKPTAQARMQNEIGIMRRAA